MATGEDATSPAGVEAVVRPHAETSASATSAAASRIAAGDTARCSTRAPTARIGPYRNRKSVDGTDGIGIGWE